MSSFDYSGLPQEYRPSLGDTSVPRNPTPRTAPTDYHNLPLLKELLKRLIAETESIKADASNVLVNYNLSITPQTKLYEAQSKLVNTDSVPDHISFTEYTTINNANNRAATFIRSEYENNMRSPGGSNALDVYMIASIINTEARNIDSFTDTYLGDIGDTSEFRAIELFQEWAQGSFKHAGALRYFLQERDKDEDQLTEAELDEVDSETAKQYQAVFQAKLNTVNGQYMNTLDAFKKENTYLSKVFYRNVLGPALYFRTRVMSKVEPVIPGQVKKTKLGSEILSAQASMNSNMAGALTDLLRRNQNYEQRISTLFQLLKFRSKYNTYIEQLGQKGVDVNRRFAPQDKVQILPSSAFVQEKNLDNDYVSKHSLLDGIEEADAHPQYILRDGGSVLSDLHVADGVKIDGVKISQHSHRGVDIDGTPQISGADIEEGTLYSELVDATYRNEQPSGLSVDQQTVRRKQGVVQVDATFKWQQAGDERFEIQIVPYGSLAPAPTPAFENHPHSSRFRYFSTEDSNFISHRSLDSNTLLITDANKDFDVYDLPIEKPFDSTKPMLPVNLDGNTFYADCVEVGVDLYYINPSEGIYKTQLVDPPEELIHENGTTVYGKTRVIRRSYNICYNSNTKKLHWFDVDYSVENDKISSMESTLWSYDTVSGEFEVINTYPTFKNGNYNIKYLFCPTINAAIASGETNKLYLCAVDVQTDENEIHFRDDLTFSLLEFDLSNGQFVQLESFTEQENPLYSMYAYDGLVYALSDNYDNISYGANPSPPIEDWYKTVIAFDENGEFEAFEITDIDLGDLVLAITSDIYGNTYANIRRDEAYLVQRVTVE